MKTLAVVTLGGALLTQGVAAEELFFEATGQISTQFSYFTQDAQFAGQDYSSNLSIAVEPELYWEWNAGDDSVTFKPFLRKDQRDGARTHGDIRELSWVHLGDDWELRTGVRKVFWGVTEFQHLVDTINQSDTVENLNNEEKLGQPMINLSVIKDWGIVDAFVLPGFREQTYVSSSSRFRGSLAVDDSLTTFESDKGREHLDLALRWSHSFDVYDVGLHWFKGTDRAPQYRAVSKNGNQVLQAHYQQIEQVGLDLQATIDSWLWKVEAKYQQNATEDFWASQSGFEYTFYGVNESAADIGVLLEYGYDDRGEQGGIMQNDVAIGARLTLNDEASSELLAGVLYDLDSDGTSFQVEASRRIGDDWKAEVELNVYSSDQASDPVSNLDRDDRVLFTLRRYF
ncbi:MAG: hypothetical protein ACPG4U_13925 [Pseudomonadales bacterium]